jgi:type IV secretion system protein VirB4
MMFLREHARRASRLSDFLPWAALVAPGIVLNKDGSFMRVARFRGPDLDSAAQAELMATSARLNSALKRLGTGWAIYVEAQRKASPGYPVSSGFADPVSALIDEERRAQFEGGDTSQPNFTSTFYLSLQWLPPADDTSRASSMLFEGGAEGIASAADHLDDFERDTARVLDMIAGVMPEAVWLSDSETLTYLHSTISTNDQLILVPDTPMHLDALLADELLVGGLTPKLGDQHLRCLSITGFPAWTVPGMLDELNRLGFAYRWTTRAICMDKVTAQRTLNRIRRLWFSKRKSLAAIIKEVLTNEASVLVDTDAANKSDDADAALQELGADIAGFAYATTTIVVLGDTPRDADLRLQSVEKIVRGRDFACIPEGLNALEAWLGSLPGNPYANVRQPPISTLNLAHVMPVSAVWAGPDEDAHFKAPPLFHARTEGATPFRFSLHVGDVGHTFVVGPTGSGKSVLLAFMALQFRRYEGAQIFAFDHGGSIRAATLGIGGEWHDLGGVLGGGDAKPVSLQPLSRIDELDERAWAADWLGAILTREGFALTPEVKDHLWTALGSLADAPVQQRTLTGLAAHPGVWPEAGARTLHPRGTLWPLARRRRREFRDERRAGVRDRGTGRHARSTVGACLSVPPHRTAARRTADADHDRRGLAGARRSAVRPPAQGMAENAAQEECECHLRHPESRGHRGQRDRAGAHRELPDTPVPRQRASARAADSRHLSPLRAE